MRIHNIALVDRHTPPPPPPPPTWTKAQSRELLSRFPLPGALEIGPVHTLAPGRGFGRWLEETPHHPGKFEALHEWLATVTAALAAPGRS